MACGYAALSMMSPDLEVLTVHFSINFLKPATTRTVVAVGKVIQQGRTLTVLKGRSSIAHALNSLHE